MINTKLRPPRLREGHATRPRLLAQLDHGLSQGLIPICAPARYGKASLAVEWLAQRSALTSPGLATAWASLDESDSGLDIFLRYQTTAVHNAFSPARPCAYTQELLGAPQPPPTQAVADTLINSCGLRLSIRSIT